MKILMLDTITYGDDISLDKFKTLGEVITYRTSTQEEALQRIKEIQPDVVVTNKVVITKELFEASPNIKMVAETATGYNNIDIEYAKAHQIRLLMLQDIQRNQLCSISSTFILCIQKN